MARKKIFDILDIITNVLIIPVLLLGLFCSILMFNAKQHNGVPSLFGYSAVKILTSSMETAENPQFAQGQTVLVKKVNTDELIPGDVIAFYEYIAPEDEDATQTFARTFNTELSGSEFVGGEVNEASQAGSRVLFHRIVEIHEQIDEPTDEVVHRFFVTKGDVNSSPDMVDGKIAYIRDDFVVGVYTESSGFVTGLFSFCASTTGIICLVLLPAGIILVMVSISLIEQINSAVNEKNQNRKKMIEAEKLLQGEGPTGANMNLNSNLPPKATEQKPSVTPEKPSVPPKSAPIKPDKEQTASVTSTKTASQKVTPAKPDASAKTTPAKPSVTPKVAPAKPATPPKATPAKPASATKTVPPKPVTTKTAPAKPTSVPPKAPPPKPTDKK